MVGWGERRRDFGLLLLLHGEKINTTIVSKGGDHLREPLCARVCACVCMCARICVCVCVYLCLCETAEATGVCR